MARRQHCSPWRGIWTEGLALCGKGVRRLLLGESNRTRDRVPGSHRFAVCQTRSVGARTGEKAVDVSTAERGADDRHALIEVDERRADVCRQGACTEVDAQIGSGRDDGPKRCSTTIDAGGSRAAGKNIGACTDSWHLGGRGYAAGNIMEVIQRGVCGAAGSGPTAPTQKIWI